MQQIIVILIVAACVAWLGVLAYRYFRPKPGGKACAGGCCDAGPKPANEEEAPARARTQMISSGDLRARLKARRG
jgi:hypothetical protein